MNLNVLKTLPMPPIDKTGWPWTVESAPMPQLMPQGAPWPKISIVTPSYNQGQFLEETIRSVLLQNYPNLEYIIIDGGSKDNSIEIIKKYETLLTYWVSEKDRGQAHAINKGLVKCTGDIFNWINSDDFLSEGVLGLIAVKIRDHDVLAGAVCNFSADGASEIIQSANLTARGMILSEGGIYHQPGTWLKREKLLFVGGLNESFHYYFDGLMTIRYLDAFPQVAYTNDVLVYFRLHESSKTVSLSDEFSVDRLLTIASLLNDKSIANKYESEILKYTLSAARNIRINRMCRNIPKTMDKVVNLFRDIISDIISYPYRYTFGAIRRLIFPSRR